MRFVNEMRPDTIRHARGDVLEVGFGTGLNLRYYPTEQVRGLWAVDPLDTTGVGKISERIEKAPFPVTRMVLRADGQLPFDAHRFDCVVTTWTLCSIPDPEAALAEMKRVLKPEGRYLFLEHGRSRDESTRRWQDRVNPVWRRIAEGCNINRPIDQLVRKSGFELTALDEFIGKGPPIASTMYRGVAVAH
jgi:ubiquinone/menaquinone biosynthesis C-methylase UbiE